jgi:hypothetical protein
MELTRENIEDFNNAIEFFIAISLKGNYTEKDLPALYGDGSRWHSLTLGGFIAAYRCFVYALGVSKQSVDNIIDKKEYTQNDYIAEAEGKQ